MEETTAELVTSDSTSSKPLLNEMHVNQTEENGISNDAKNTINPLVVLGAGDESIAQVNSSESAMKCEISIDLDTGNATVDGAGDCVSSMDTSETNAELPSVSVAIDHARHNIQATDMEGLQEIVINPDIVAAHSSNIPSWQIVEDTSLSTKIETNSDNPSWQVPDKVTEHTLSTEHIPLNENPACQNVEQIEAVNLEQIEAKSETPAWQVAVEVGNTVKHMDNEPLTKAPSWQTSTQTSDTTSSNIDAKTTQPSWRISEGSSNTTSSDIHSGDKNTKEAANTEMGTHIGNPSLQVSGELEQTSPSWQVSETLPTIQESSEGSTEHIYSTDTKTVMSLGEVDQGFETKLPMIPGTEVPEQNPESVPQASMSVVELTKEMVTNESKIPECEKLVAEDTASKVHEIETKTAPNITNDSTKAKDSEAMNDIPEAQMPVSTISTDVVKTEIPSWQVAAETPSLNSSETCVTAATPVDLKEMIDDGPPGTTNPPELNKSSASTGTSHGPIAVHPVDSTNVDGPPGTKDLPEVNTDTVPSTATESGTLAPKPVDDAQPVIKASTTNSIPVMPVGQPITVRDTSSTSKPPSHIYRPQSNNPNSIQYAAQYGQWQKNFSGAPQPRPPPPPAPPPIQEPQEPYKNLQDSAKAYAAQGYGQQWNQYAQYAKQYAQWGQQYAQYYGQPYGQQYGQQYGQSYGNQYNNQYGNQYGNYGQYGHNQYNQGYGGQNQAWSQGNRYQNQPPPPTIPPVNTSVPPPTAPPPPAPPPPPPQRQVINVPIKTDVASKPRLSAKPPLPVAKPLGKPLGRPKAVPTPPDHQPRQAVKHYNKPVPIVPEPVLPQLSTEEIAAKLLQKARAKTNPDASLAKRPRIEEHVAGCSPAPPPDEWSTPKHLCIGNLPQGTKATALRDMLTSFGKVIMCKVAAGKGANAGIFAFVTMETIVDIGSLLSSLNGWEFNGAKLTAKKLKNPPGTKPS